MEKGYEKTVAMAMLKNLCIAKQYVRCDKCCFVEMSSGGHGVPYCKVITMIDSCCRNEGHAIIYKLKEGTIPKECKFWVSIKKEKEKRDSIKEIKHVQDAIDKLKQEEKSQLRL